MASTNATQSPPPGRADQSEVTLFRLYLLRATYLLLVVGVGAIILPPLISHETIARGVIPSLLGAVWLLAFLGLRYPLRMLPLLMFELAWKTIWLLDFGLAQWMSGQRPPTFAEDSFNIVLGVVLMPLVIPWGYVWRHYVKQPGDRWR
ncbi:MAG: hypothetical protein QOE79_1905 [Sphingomonadales bacterium]|jgi:hypothetical protein|nr:hypothetical protein [Sphingomonadales bacterium]